MMLCGVKLKMSTAYHPETDGYSEHTNKVIPLTLSPDFHSTSSQVKELILH